MQYNFFLITFLMLWVSCFTLNAQSKQKIEVGYAEMIPATNNGKYQALHKTAPVGTVIMVKNTYNSVAIQVKVIGRLPSTGNNEKVIIKLSQAAFRYLNAKGDKNKRFGVEISYVTF